MNATWGTLSLLGNKKLKTAWESCISYFILSQFVLVNYPSQNTKQSPNGLKDLKHFQSIKSFLYSVTGRSGLETLGWPAARVYQLRATQICKLCSNPNMLASEVKMWVLPTSQIWISCAHLAKVLHIYGEFSQMYLLVTYFLASFVFLDTSSVYQGDAITFSY